MLTVLCSYCIMGIYMDGSGLTAGKPAEAKGKLYSYQVTVRWMDRWTDRVPSTETVRLEIQMAFR